MSGCRTDSGGSPLCGRACRMTPGGRAACGGARAGERPTREVSASGIHASVPAALPQTPFPPEILRRRQGLGWLCSRDRERSHAGATPDAVRVGPPHCGCRADQIEIVIHPVSLQGGRKVTAHALGVDTDLGRAFTPADVSELLRRGAEAVPRCGPATSDAIVHKQQARADRLKRPRMVPPPAPARQSPSSRRPRTPRPSPPPCSPPNCAPPRHVPQCGPCGNPAPARRPWGTGVHRRVPASHLTDSVTEMADRGRMLRQRYAHPNEDRVTQQVREADRGRTVPGSPDRTAARAAGY